MMAQWDSDRRMNDNLIRLLFILRSYRQFLLHGVLQILKYLRYKPCLPNILCFSNLKVRDNLEDIQVVGYSITDFLK